MKIKDFDFRIVEKPNKDGNYNVCSNTKCKCNNPFLYGNEALSRLGEFIGEDVEVEMYSGFNDKDGSKIYEGDILAHDNGHGIEYHSKVIFENGSFRLAIIEHPAVELIEDLGTEFIKVIGNIHEKGDKDE